MKKIELPVEEKKITVRHFLNKRLKAKVNEQNGDTYYTPYIQVVYDRKNCQFPFNWDVYYENLLFENRYTEDEYDEYVLNPTNEDCIANLREVNEIVKKAVLFEREYYKENFTLKGFGKRFDFYIECFSCELDKYIENELETIVKADLGLNRKQVFHLFRTLELEPLHLIYHIEKKFEVDIEKKISSNLMYLIEASKLFEFFMYNNEDDYYYSWLFNGLSSDFKEFISKKVYSKEIEFNYKAVEIIDDKDRDPQVYIDAIEQFITKRLKPLK